MFGATIVKIGISVNDANNTYNAPYSVITFRTLAAAPQWGIIAFVTPRDYVLFTLTYLVSVSEYLCVEATSLVERSKGDFYT